MHPSPKYSRLQAIQSLHAEVSQQVCAVAIAASERGNERFSAALAKVGLQVEALFRLLEDQCIYGEFQGGFESGRALDRSVRSELSWLTDAVRDMLLAIRSDSLSGDDCDAILIAIADRTVGVAKSRG